MRNILDEIVAKRKENLPQKFTPDTVRFLREKISTCENPRAFYENLDAAKPWGIIAEIKACSPSKGIILEKPEPVFWAKLYEQCGASAISIVTETDYFKGETDWIAKAKQASSLPVLRKDFLTTKEELLESRLLGADAVLLIAAILEKETLIELVEEIFFYGMEPVVEVHTMRELRNALETRTRIIGINNRNLQNFSVDLNVTKELLPHAEQRMIVSESGFVSRKDLEELSLLGARAFLVGERFLTGKNPKEIVLEFAGKTSNETP